MFFRPLIFFPFHGILILRILELSSDAHIAGGMLPIHLPWLLRIHLEEIDMKEEYRIENHPQFRHLPN